MKYYLKFLTFIFSITVLTACVSVSSDFESVQPTTAVVGGTAVSLPTKTPRLPTVTAIPASTKTSTLTQTPISPTRTPITWNLLTTTPTPTQIIAQLTATVPSNTVPSNTIPSNSTYPQAKVLSPEINVRTGPGIGYSIKTVLKQGETVDVVGATANKDWYQVGRNGQILGWLSSWFEYISISPEGADVPIVNPSSTSSSASLSTSNKAPQNKTIGRDKLILQTHSGGPFYLTTSNGTELKYITTGIDPAFSPDGTKIAFTRWDNNEFGSIWIYDLNTATEKVILGETREAKSPTWSPDGSQLIINFQHGGRREIESKCYKMRSDGSFHSIPPRSYDFKFSGSKLCFKLPPDTHWQLRQIDVNSGQFQDLPSATYSFAPTWDPINPWRIIFASSTGLQQLDLNQKTYVPFTTDVRDHAPVMSPDGKYLAVTYKQHEHWEVYTIDVRSGSRYRLTKSNPLLGQAFNSAAPAWSPDSSQLAFITNRQGKWEFWVMNRDGSNPRPLLSPALASNLQINYHGVDERLISWSQ